MDIDTARETITANRTRGIPAGQTTTVRLTVTSGKSAAATVIALAAPNAVWAARHSEELSELPTEELYELLIDVSRLAETTAALQRKLMLELRASGASWSKLGAALDVTRSAAKDRHDRITHGGANVASGKGYTRIQKINQRLDLMIEAVQR